MKDWEKLSMKKVFAGTGCIMAVTEDGRTLQKIADPTRASRTEYWTRIAQISVSNCCCGHAIGLVQDGTCMIAKRPLRFLTDRHNFIDALSFNEVNNKIKSWSRIVQVAVSDSYFALDADGKVHYAAANRFEENDYHDVTMWTNVKKMVPALQNGILCITGEGKILCAGASFTKGPHGNAQKKLSEFNHVIDVCVTGSEGEEVYVVMKDGTIIEAFSGRKLDGFKAYHSSADEKTIDCTFDYKVFCLDSNRLLRSLNDDPTYPPVRYFSFPFIRYPEQLSSFAVKDGEIIAVSV